MKRVKRVKRIISAITAAALCAAAVPAAMANGYYADVNDSAYYATAVGRLADFGVMRGYEDGTFRPDNVVTRAEAAALMCAAKNERPEWSEDGDYVQLMPITNTNYTGSFPATEITGFPDVSGEHWAYLYIAAAQKLTPAPIKGYEDGTFRPDDTVTYQEFIKMCLSMLGYDPFAEEKGGYPEGYLAQAKDSGLTDGLGSFDPGRGLMRSDAAVILANTLETPVVGMGEAVFDENGAVSFPPKIMDGTGGYYQTPLTMFFNIYKVTASAVGSGDAPEPRISESAYAEAEKDLKALEIIGGDFDPEKEITRGEFAKYARSLMYRTGEEIVSRYDMTDAKGDNDIHTMVRCGYMEPETETLFGAAEPETRLDMYRTLINMLYRKQGRRMNQTELLNSAKEFGLDKGIDNFADLNLSRNITGREMAAALHNALDADRKMNPLDEDASEKLRDMLNNNVTKAVISDKGEKVFEFKDVELKAFEETKIGTVDISKFGKADIMRVTVSLEDAPAYCDYYISTQDDVSGAGIDTPFMCGDMFMERGGGGNKWEVYISCSPVSAKVSGAVYLTEIK